MNLETFEKLQLNEVKELVKIYCVSSLGKNLINKLMPSNNYSVVKNRLSENKEARKVLENSNHVPLEGLFDINPLIGKVEKGMILETQELVSCEDFLRGCRKTITLKTVGILTLMTQYGFDILAKENSEISIFEKVFIDIWYNQSIENASSTFSSHIKILPINILILKMQERCLIRKP